MWVGYIQINNDNQDVEQILVSEHSTRQEAHIAAVALADSLVGVDNVLEVQRGYKDSETTFASRVQYDIPPTEQQRNPS